MVPLVGAESFLPISHVIVRLLPLPAGSSGFADFMVPIGHTLNGCLFREWKIPGTTINEMCALYS